MTRFYHRCGVCGRFMRPYPIDYYCDSHCWRCSCSRCEPEHPVYMEAETVSAPYFCDAFIEHPTDSWGGCYCKLPNGHEGDHSPHYADMANVHTARAARRLLRACKAYRRQARRIEQLPGEASVSRIGGEPVVADLGERGIATVGLLMAQHRVALAAELLAEELRS